MSTRIEAILAFLILLLLAAALPVSATEEEEELFKAIRTRQADVVDGLLDHKPELLNARRKGSSPVMAALFILDVALRRLDLSRHGPAKPDRTRERALAV